MSVIFNVNDRGNLVNKNRGNFAQHGYSPLSLNWDKGKQDIRFDILSSFFNVRYKSIVDIGCGFGDLLFYLRNLGCGHYTGVDITPEFIEEAKKLHAEDNCACFEVDDFLNENFNHQADLFFASGPFNYKFENTDNYEFIVECMKKAFKLAGEGLAFDFLSDKVDWKYDHAWYSNPAIILEMAYGLSRNVVLRNDYMPFEFSVAIFKDESFETADTLFNRYKEVKQLL